MKTIFFLLIGLTSVLQAQTFTKADSLKNSDNVYRDFWDVKKYEITVEPNFDRKTVSGTNTIYFEITKAVNDPTFQIDLQQPMNFKIISDDAQTFATTRDGDFIFIKAKKKYQKGELHSFTIQYSGAPKIAKNAPWDGFLLKIKMVIHGCR